MTPAEQKLDALVESLRARCQQEGRPVTPDDCVRPTDAAALVGKSARTLENWRVSGDTRLPWRRGVGALRYCLWDIAQALLSDTHGRA